MQAMKTREPSGSATSTYRKTSRVERTPGHDPVNLWGIAGRQEMMEMRRLWQLRMPRSRHPRE